MLELLQVLAWIFFEIRQAVFAAQFDFLPLLREDVRLSMAPELVASHDAPVEWIGLCLFGLLSFLLLVRGDCGRSNQAITNRMIDQHFIAKAGSEVSAQQRV